MAIFSRRSLQRLIQENSAFLLPRQSRRHVDALNRMEKEFTLAPEWEVVVLNSLSKTGRVIHEKNFGGNRYADVYWESLQDPNHNFVADITAVSDKGLDQLNPFGALSDELNKVVAGRGLDPRCFWLHVGVQDERREKGGPKVRLKLPGRARFYKRIFGGDFNAFLDYVSNDPKSPTQHQVQTDEVSLHIRYNPTQQFAGGSYLDYAAVYSLNDNTIYNALSDKAAQLYGTNFHGPRGIILCDGDCKFLSQPAIGNLSYTLDEVIGHFLNKNGSVYFILTCVVKDVGGSSPYLGPFQLSLHLYTGLQFNEIPFDLWKIVQALSFPAPKLNARNAMNVLKGPKPHEGSKRGVKTTMEEHKTTVRLSTRNVLELLAGRITQAEFFERCGDSFAQSALEQALRGGELIVSVEKLNDEDDDWLVFELRGPDPAISPFDLPKPTRTGSSH